MKQIPRKSVDLRFVSLLFVFIIGFGRATAQNAVAQADTLSIGTIQGPGDASPYRSDRVSFRGIVTGIQEDQNTRGAIYYTAFVQDLLGSEDGDPATSDGIAVFFGRNRPQMPVGAIVTISGEVTEFYGFTEIDDDDLRVTIERNDGVLPEAVIIDPPADLDEQHAYFEPLEGMRVRLDGPARVVGPTHEGCGFAVVAATDPPEPVMRRAIGDPTGRVIPVLYPTDVDCSDMVPLKTGDLIDELEGILIYNFDEFKILMESSRDLAVTESDFVPVVPMPELATLQLSTVTINTNDWFDSESLTGNPDEPVLPPEVLTVKETKLARALTELLHCPTLVAIQEVEHAALLDNLAAMMAPACGFTYTVSHAESADARGIDNGLLTDQRRVTVHSVAPQQVCSPVPTDHEDASIECDAGGYVLFDRPPLQVDMTIDGRHVVAFVNHFKSKREGEDVTALERLAQARFQNALVADWLAEEPDLPILVMGDLNDYELSAPLRTLTDPAPDGQLVNALAAIPDKERYSYVFGGVSGLLDQVLVSPPLATSIQATGILHINADYPSAWTEEINPESPPYRFSDHDIPWIIWRLVEPLEPTLTPPATATDAPAEPTAATDAPTPTIVPPAVAEVMTPLPVLTVPPPGPVSPMPTPAPQRPLWPWLLGAIVVAAIGAIVLLRHRS